MYWKRRAKDSVIVTVGSMAFVIVLNSKSRCSVKGFCAVKGFCESQAGAIAVAICATVFEVDLVLRAVFVVA